MAEGEQRVELKFRIYDGTDIGHSTYAPSTSVATLKQRLVAEWPQGYYSHLLFTHELVILLIKSECSDSVNWLCCICLDYCLT